MISKPAATAASSESRATSVVSGFGRTVIRAVFAGLVAVMALSTWTVGRAADDAGERVYDDHCKRCHGAEGRGTAQAPSLIPFDWSYEEALELIRHPVCNMPPVPASVVTDAQVAQLVAYLKTIK
jgi:mono/diheme cytochrome c family protein